MEQSIEKEEEKQCQKHELGREGEGVIIKNNGQSIESQKNEEDWDDVEEEEEKKDNEMDHISLEGPSLQQIPNQFPNTSFMPTREQNVQINLNNPIQSTEEIFEKLNLLVTQLGNIHEFKKWKGQLIAIQAQMEEGRIILAETLEPSIERIDQILEQLTIIRSQFDTFTSETRNDSNSQEAHNIISQIDQLLQSIISVALNQQNLQVNKIFSTVPNQHSNSNNIPQMQSQRANPIADQPINANNIPVQENNNNRNQNNNGFNQNINGPNIPVNMNNVQVMRRYQLSLDLRVFQNMGSWFGKMLKNFDLMLKCVIMVSSLFLMLAFQRQDDSKLSPVRCGEKVDPFVDTLKWMSFGKSSDMIAVNLSIILQFMSVLILRRVWRVLIGEFTESDRNLVQSNYFRFCGLKHLIIIKMIESSLWNNSFDIFVASTLYVQVSVSRFFTEILSDNIKKLLSGLTEDSKVRDMQMINKMRKFNRLIFLWDLSTLALNLVLFQSVDILVLLKLLLNLFLALLHSVRVELTCRKLFSDSGLQYYVNCNSDIIEEPTLQLETNFGIAHLLLKGAYLIYIGSLYFWNTSMDMSVSLLLLYYFLFSIPYTFKRLQEHWRTRRSLLYFRKNLDSFFPKLVLSHKNKEDICSICHDQLLVARRLTDCSHAFHLKCLFQWIKTQQNPRCPNCRVEIAHARSINSALNINQPLHQNQQQPLQFNIISQFSFLQPVNINNVQNPNPVPNII